MINRVYIRPAVGYTCYRIVLTLRLYELESYGMVLLPGFEPGYIPCPYLRLSSEWVVAKKDKPIKCSKEPTT